VKKASSSVSRVTAGSVPYGAIVRERRLRDRGSSTRLRGMRNRPLHRVWRSESGTPGTRGSSLLDRYCSQWQRLVGTTTCQGGAV
jgi:hypothetical protein